MGNEAPVHWTDFDSLYDLDDPRPYFRGVAYSDYRMPGVLAGVLARLLPVIAHGRETRLIDFACGYGAVGLCLRYGLTMADLYRFYAEGECAGDAGYFKALEVSISPQFQIDGIDIAGNALRYAEACGALDEGYAENVLEGPISEALKASLQSVDLIYESGAIGDHVAAAMAGILGHARPNRPALLLCPRPRVNLQPLREVLAVQGYTLHTLVPKVRYRTAFSASEMAEEVAQGIANGLRDEDCTIGEYFRVDVRLAIPEEKLLQPYLDALNGFDTESP